MRRRRWAQTPEGEQLLLGMEARLPPEWRARAEQAILAFAARRVEFTATDVARAMGEEHDRGGKRLGGVFQKFAKAGIIRKVRDSDEPARRRSHGQTVAVWIGVAKE